MERLKRLALDKLGELDSHSDDENLESSMDLIPSTKRYQRRSPSFIEEICSMTASPQSCISATLSDTGETLGEHTASPVRHGNCYPKDDS
jgi:hypothetical protein